MPGLGDMSWATDPQLGLKMQGAYEGIRNADREREEYLRQLQQRKDYENAMVNLQNPQTISKLVSNQNYMSPQEIAGVVGPEAEVNAMNRIRMIQEAAAKSGQPAPAIDQNQMIQQERQKLMAGVSPQMQEQQKRVTETLPFEAKSYGELMAMQQHAKNVSDAYGPMLTSAFNAQNASAMQAIAERFKKTGNPMLMQAADMISGIKFTGKDEFEVPVDLSTPEAKKSMFDKFQEFYKAAGVSDPSMIADGWYNMTFKGSLADKTLYPQKATRVDKPVKAGADKTKVEFAIATDKDKKGLLARPDITPEVKEAIASVKPDPKKSIKLGDKVDGKFTSSDITSQPVTNVSVIGGTGGGAEAPFSSWDKDTKEWWFRTKRDTGESPNFGYGKAAAGSRALFSKEYAKWSMGEGKSGAQQRTETETSKADYASLKQATKTYDSMKPFVGNMDAQIKRINELSKSMPSSDAARILAMPINEAKQYILGNADMAKYRMYITEIENEAGKLATGSSGSVRELSVSAQDKWAKIHDKNMPISEMLKLLKETRDMGKMRLDEQAKIVKEIKGRMRKSGGVAPPTTRDQLIESYMRNNPKATRQQIENSEPFKADLRKFRL